MYFSIIVIICLNICWKFDHFCQILIDFNKHPMSNSDCCCSQLSFSNIIYVCMRRNVQLFRAGHWQWLCGDYIPKALFPINTIVQLNIKSIRRKLPTIKARTIKCLYKTNQIYSLPKALKQFIEKICCVSQDVILAIILKVELDRITVKCRAINQASANINIVGNGARVNAVNSPNHLPKLTYFFEKWRPLAV